MQDRWHRSQVGPHGAVPVMPHHISTAHPIDRRHCKLRISLFVRTLFSDELVMFAEHAHRNGDGLIRLGKFSGSVQNRFLDDQLTEVWHQAVIDVVQLNIGKRPKSDV